MSLDCKIFKACKNTPLPVVGKAKFEVVMEDVVPSGDQIVAEESPSLSYKFQRLREKLRKAIADGDLSGKLPGERTLSRRFHVNAKTLSKALTDLAAEGLLERSIGRGTYVRGSAPPVVTAKRARRS